MQPCCTPEPYAGSADSQCKYLGIGGINWTYTTPRCYKCNHTSFLGQIEYPVPIMSKIVHTLAFIAFLNPFGSSILTTVSFGNIAAEAERASDSATTRVFRICSYRDERSPQVHFLSKEGPRQCGNITRPVIGKFGSHGSQEWSYSGTGRFDIRVGYTMGIR